MIMEGTGFLLRRALDTPYAGWVGSRFLEEGLASVHAAPARALSRLLSVSALCPGGLALLWDHAPAWMAALHPEERTGWWEALSAVPGLQLHLQGEEPTLPGGCFRAWLHGAEPPSEPWRQGSLGWIPDPPRRWGLPGLAMVQPARNEEAGCGWLWGEVTVPVGALATLNDEEALPLQMGETQTQAEIALAQRMAAGAWPEALPFLRRQAGWRLALTGGLEFQRAGGDWAVAAAAAAALKERLSKTLRAPVYLGVSHDPHTAALLGRRAMAEGQPWRNTLPLPPLPSAFTPGLASDPRDPVPVQARGTLPGPMAEVIDHPPLALLRLPGIPSEGAAAQLRKDLAPGLALRLLPSDIPPPGPFDPDHPWAPAEQYPMPMDPAAGEQVALFAVE